MTHQQSASSTAAAAHNPSSSSPQPQKAVATCHILPCNADYTGPVDGRQFQPQSVVSTNDNTTITQEQDVQAVTLRGRGLLAPAAVELVESSSSSTSSSSPNHHHSNKNGPITGRVYQVVGGGPSSSSGGPMLTEVSALQFLALQEWHHEHLPGAVSLKANASRTHQALEWCSVAHALHTPLPVQEEE